MASVPAGRFSTWFRRARRALESKGSIDVPCGDCRGCCTSSYFIHVAPDEIETLAQIPKKLLFPAPGMPKGHVLLGYDEKGHCPMFKDNACSIYAHRPRTCRAYDCRVFAATGIAVEESKPAIARQIPRWKFALESPEDEARLKAARAAARFLMRHADDFPEGFLPRNAAAQAALALRVHALFLQEGKKPQDRIAAIMAACEISR
jgi:Fe-S-cluster containining protein